MPRGIPKQLEAKITEQAQQIITLSKQVVLLEETNKTLNKQLEYLTKQNTILLQKALQPAQVADFTVFDALQRAVKEGDTKSSEEVTKETNKWLHAFDEIYGGTDYDFDGELDG